MTETVKRYTSTARAIHWLMAVPILALLLLGQQTMGNHTVHFLPSVHASAGFVILALLVVRLWWRWRNPPPEPLVKSGWEMMASKLAHGLLYAAMLFIPLSGWLAYTEHVHRSLGIRPASLFGLRIPLLPDFGINWHFLHNWGGKIALALIALHVAAALKHHFYNKDDTLKRMLP
ncbi:MAG: cytochrome b [Aestuariivirga sp.]